jgi:hypothetical protein
MILVSRDGAPLRIPPEQYNPNTDLLWVEPTEAPKPVLESPALALINGSNVIRDIAIIPTLGQAAAKLILLRRPEGGYESLAQVWELCPEVLTGRMMTNPSTVENWGG